MSQLAPLRDYINSLVHPSVQQDALAAARHRAFIAPRLIGSFAALATFPIYLTLRGVPNWLEIIVFSWLVAPILISYFLSRTGQYESAHLLSALALTGLATVVAYNTGGITSFAAIWLVVVPLEAALSASRRIVALASVFALGAAGLLVAVSATGHAAAISSLQGEQGSLAAVGVISATLYAAGLALGSETLARTTFWLLCAEEDRYRLLARNMTDVITRHGRNGSVLFASPGAETLFGVRIQDLRGHGMFERVHVADRPAYLTALGDAAALGETRTVEFRARCGDAADGLFAGEFRWIEMRCRPLDRTAGAGASGSANEVVAVMHDITDRKLQELAIEDAHAEAERAHASKSRFLATMSHELRTPLNAIIGFSEMLMQEENLMLDARRRREYADLINGSGHHLLSVVNGILDMSKMESGNFEIAPEPFAPTEVIESCCHILGLKARENGIDLDIRLPAMLPAIVADKRALNQIMFNLLSNAIKFTDRGGRVTVSARVEGQNFKVSVEDNGLGISDEDLRRVGEPFFQARASYSRRHDGTGLGLSIVKGLLVLHGGDIDIRSRVGQGTTVTIRLPLDCEQAMRSREPSPIAHLAPRTAEVAVEPVKMSA